MQLLRRHTSRSALFAGFAGLAILAAACTDRSDPVGPGPGGPEGPGGVVGPPGKPVTFQAVFCTASRGQKTVDCSATPRDKSGSGARTTEVIIPGPNGRFVTVTSSNVNWDPATEKFTFDVTIRNEIPQPLGTADTTGALAPDPAGVRLWFRRRPTVLDGTGEVAIDNATDSTVYLENLSPYYQYNTVLEENETSAPKTWQFDVPPTAELFDFILYVSAAVPRPNGYITLEANPDIRPGFQRQVSPTVRRYWGEIDSLATADAAFTWFSSDSTRAKVDSEGLVKGLRFGSTTVGVETTLNGQPVSGKVVMNVRRTRRIWAGTVSTDWNHPGNWRPAATLEPDAAGEFNVVPEAQDTAVIPAAGAISNFPVLVENENIGGVEVSQGSIALNAFNLTATGSVFTETPGIITSSSGRLVLAGIAQTVRGNVPRLLVTGTYSLDGNLTVMQQIRVQLGRLRSQGFRIRQIPS
jgi:hypothetical protein